MSLDLGNKRGVARTDFAAPITGDLSTLVASDFTTGSVENANELFVYIDTQNSNLTIVPSTTIVGLEDGDTMTVQKVGDGGRIVFVDPVTSETYDFANRDTEAYTLLFDGTSWSFKA